VLRILNSETTTAFLVGSLLMAYLVLRAVYTPILHDEVATFFYYIQTGVYLPPNAHWDANNHLLNSFLGHLSFKLFGHEPWALRLPNVALYPLYILYSWKTASTIRTTMLRWGVFLALICATYIFEYFALARGYGMSMAFLVMGIYLFINGLRNNNISGIYFSILALAFGVAANLTLIYIYLMMVFGTLLYLLFLRNINPVKRALSVFGYLLYSSVLILPLLYFSFELKSRGALYYGGKSSFIDYTLKPLLKLLIGSDNQFAYLSVIIIFFAASTITIILFISGLKKRTFDVNLVYPIILTGSVLAIFSARYILDLNFPEDRTAMYLYPISIIAVSMLIDKMRHKQALISNIIGVLCLYIPLRFMNNINVNQALFAPEERHAQVYFDYIQRWSANADNSPTIGGYATQSFCWSYMNYSEDGRQNQMLYSTYLDTLCDFQIVRTATKLSNDFENIYSKLNTKSINNLDLYERNQKLKKEHVVLKSNITNWNHSSDEFYNLLEVERQDNWENKVFTAQIEGIIHAPHKPFYATITFSQKDENWNEISQERVVLNWLKYDWSDNKETFKQQILLPSIYKSTKYIQIYLWNIKKQPYLIHKCSVTLHYLY